ncbi:MAG: S41 family peptidase [Cellulosilyticaceae bacterium]
MMRKKRWVVGVGVGCLAGLVIAGIGVGCMQLGAKQEEQFSKRKAANLEMMIQKYYMGELDSNEMLEGLYKGYVYGLDDAGTRYLTADEYEKEAVAKKGEYLGTGIEFTWGLGSQNLIVTGVVPKSPAEQAGIVVGDKIVAIDGVKAMMSNEVQIYEKLTYAGKNAVKYTVTTNGDEPKGEVSLVADVVDKVLTEHRLLDGQVGYIKVNGLPQGAAAEVEAEIKELEEKGAKKLVLDLRGTQSNDLDEVKALADLFTQSGELFSVKGKNDKETTYYASKGATDLPMGIMTNHYTSGAIEGFVLAMKAQARGVIVGEPTSGKGTVQELVALQDGSGLYVTTKLLMDQEGKIVKGKGIAPDILERVPTEDTLEMVTTGHLTDESDTLLQKTIAAIN